jgi:type I restriction enzyme S subunit
MREGWEVRKFEDCLQKVKSSKKIPKKKFLADGKYPIVSQEKELINGFWNNSEHVFKVDKPIVIFGDHTKIVKLITFDFVKGADGIVILLPIDEINSNFFAYQLKNIKLRDLGYARHYRLLKENEIVYPPLPEQKQIVAILDQAFAAIDKAKANIEKNITNAKELFQSKLNAIFSHPSAGSGQGGDGWEEKKIEEVSKVVNGYSFKSKDFSVENEIKSIKITNVGIMEFVEDSSNNLPFSFLNEYSKVKVCKGDLVLALTRTIIAGGLKVARVPESYHNALLNQRVAAIAPNSDLIDSDYLYYYFSSNIVFDYVLDNVNTLMQPNLSIGDLKKMPVPITSIKRQKEISKQIEDLSEKNNMLINNYNKKLKDLEDLKKSILQKAFAGELTSAGSVANKKTVEA